jgi:3'-phosphoadenosine 5'-phosphosulfate sulfotransferase (PAPS reductase)/FAD synthetase
MTQTEYDRQRDIEAEGQRAALYHKREVPSFIRPWTAPFHVTMDGIKDAKGCWVCSAANNKLAHELVELMNFAADLAAEKAVSP